MPSRKVPAKRKTKNEEGASGDRSGVTPHEDHVIEIPTPAGPLKVFASSVEYYPEAEAETSAGKRKDDKSRAIRPKYQIFVSSTFGDLHAAREAVTWEILKLGHIPTGMENFSAEPDRGWAVIRRTIDASDYYLLLIAGRYGSVIDSSDSSSLSWTELEYDYALDRGLPVIAFIRDPSAITSDQMDMGDLAQRLSKFKNKVRDRHLVEVWRTSDDLRARVAIAIQKKIQLDEDEGQPRPGWYRGPLEPSARSGIAADNIRVVKQEFDRLMEDGRAIAGLPDDEIVEATMVWMHECDYLLAAADQRLGLPWSGVFYNKVWPRDPITTSFIDAPNPTIARSTIKKAIAYIQSHKFEIEGMQPSTHRERR